MDTGSDTSDDDFSPERFRIVRRRLSRPQPGTDQEGAGAVYGVPAMVALSPDPPSSPMSESDDDAQSQPRAGTDQEGAGAVDAPMAMETRSPDPLYAPPPRSESSDARRSQPAMLPALTPPYTVESIFDNYSKRRGALIGALTQDEEAFFQKCDPAGMQPLYLYGGMDGSWEVKVKPPLLYVPPPEPEPKPGINLSRDTMKRHKWLQEVAGHCDAWLLKISDFFASYLTPREQDQLFAMIDGLSTVQEILLASSDMCRCMPHVEEKRSSGPESNEVVEDEEKEEVHYVEEKGSSGPDEANEVVEHEQEVYLVEEQRSSGPIGANEVLEEAEDDATHDDDNFCGSCDSHYNAKGFWIGCDECKKWYHGKCVNITSSEAEHIGDYECPDCYRERCLSDRINCLQTVYETLIASEKYRRICSLGKMNENEDEDEGCGTEPTICASCSCRYHANGFWICCVVCDHWLHGKCVKITAAQAE